MRILLDTNIVIHREANRVINNDIGLLFQWFDKVNAKKIIHPLTIEEISNHKDPNIVATMKVKIGNYLTLKTESEDTEPILGIRKSDITRNDEIDTSLVKELYNDRVDIIVTEDRGIHRKAASLDIGERVFTIDSYINKVTSENPELKVYKTLAVKSDFFGNIDIDDAFFDSFKEDYSEFKKWFIRKSDEPSYVCFVDGSIGAFLYLKVENKDEAYHDITPQFPQKKRLKIGTLKVTSTGYRLGERFLKIIFDNAINNKVDEIYVTVFPKTDEQKRLIKLLEDWGFTLWGEKTTANGVERVLVREFGPKFDASSPKLNYPFISRNNQNLLVPIYPEYHTELLPDSILNNESPEDYIENAPHRNAIQKAYVSRSFNRNINSGDLVLFYRTGGYHRSVITTIGVVESVITDIRDESHFIELCRKRSIFDDNELRRHWNYKYRNGKWVPPFIVNFLYIYTFPTRLNMAKLIELGIFEGIQSAPRGFEPISLVNFNKIIKESNTNEGYFID
jgi:hypothetical protein